MIRGASEREQPEPKPAVHREEGATPEERPNHGQSFAGKHQPEISLYASSNGFDVVSQSFDHSEALHFACDEDFNRIQESIKDCKKKLEAYKKKTEEAYSDVSARDDEIERLQRELDEDMELERKINAELR
ncbi:hypothetical protein Bca4012_003911 [Brassica carinata]